MKRYWKLLAILTCVAAICGAGVLWHLYREQSAIKRKLAEAARICSARAEQGDPAAQYGIGSMYRKGEGVPQDYAQAMYWFRKAASQNYIKAYGDVASMYARGEGVPQDYAQAVRWSRKGAEQGDASAQYYLGYCYSQGKAVPQDYAEAVRWSRRAANQGDAMGEYSLGLMYSKGRGVPLDHVEAVHWLGKAADQGYTEARHTLLSMYCNGQRLRLATFIVIISLALLILAMPQRRWGRAIWIPCALCSALCAALMGQELLLSKVALAVLARGPLGLLWTRFGHAVLIAVLALGSALFALTAVRVASNRRGSGPTREPVGGNRVLKSQITEPTHRLRL